MKMMQANAKPPIEYDLAKLYVSIIFSSKVTFSLSAIMSLNCEINIANPIIAARAITEIIVHVITFLLYPLITIL
ncbi:Uncharacterised protein [Mycoplasmopsis edwardii]|uniref:Uncharacterized protein n=1 Tax=Mycoplasmopsis edwardii TaxID=53558 RepID=A0A3B0PQN7_9BACT|nr:Uncharacterised protein [Mycoplasmopsis edwardii]